MNAATPTISTDADADGRPAELSAGVIELARTAARQDAGDPALVGDFAGAESEDDVAVTVRFATTDIAYTGWSWCVTVAVVDPDQPTISEVVLLPGPESLLPPAWLPWSERIRPGDLGAGDLILPPAQDDPRLAPAYLHSDDPAVEDVAHELGIGRVRVMSRAGRADTAERWYEGSFGPAADMAKQAPLPCVMCAFFLPLAGSLGAQFGVCGNEMSPADGRAVDLGYGCGAHSELVIEPVPSGFRPSHIDDTVLDVHPRGSGIAESAAAFLGEDDSELEIRESRRVAAPETSSAAPAPADGDAGAGRPAQAAAEAVGAGVGGAAGFGSGDLQEAPPLEESPVEATGVDHNPDVHVGVSLQDARPLLEAPAESIGSDGAGTQDGSAEDAGSDTVVPEGAVGGDAGSEPAVAEDSDAKPGVEQDFLAEDVGSDSAGSEPAIAESIEPSLDGPSLDGPNPGAPVAAGADDAGPSPDGLDPDGLDPETAAAPEGAGPEHLARANAGFDSFASDAAGWGTAAADADGHSGEPAPGDADA